MATNKLEDLPSEVLLCILFSIPTVDSLQAIIYASPFAYSCFKSHKDAILQQVLLNELGPVLRDAVFCEYQDEIDFAKWDNKETMAAASAEYKRLLHESTISDILRRATPPVVLGIIRRLRLLHRYLDLITDLVLAEIRPFDASAAQPPSDAERRRLLQALFRYSALIRYDDDDKRRPRAELAYFENPCLCMFSSWELQQLADINGHLATVFYNTVDWQWTGPLGRNDNGMLMALFQALTEYGFDLRKLWKKINAAQTKGGATFAATLAEAQQARNVPEGNVRIVNTSNVHRFVALQDVPQQASYNMSREAEDDGNMTRPPFAWRDGLAGEPWSRWGSDLIDGLPEVYDEESRSPERKRVDKWRWGMFMFWDTERVLKLKQMELFADLQTGWIISV